MLKPATPRLLLCLTVLTFARAEAPAVAAAPGVVEAEPAPVPKVEKAPVPQVIASEITPAAAPAVSPAPTKHVMVYVIPVRDEINKPILYILRRGLK